MTTTAEVSSGTPSAKAVRGNEADMQLRLLLTKLRKHKWRILGAAAATTALAAVVVWSLLPVYRAKASILFEPNSSGQIIKIDELVATGDDSSEYLQTQVEILRSRQLAANVVGTLSLGEHWEFNPGLPVPKRYRPDGTVAEFVDSGVAFGQELIEKVGAKLGSMAGRQTNGGQPRVDVESAGAGDGDPGGPSAERPLEVDDGVVAAVMARTKVTPVKGTNLVRVSFDSADAALAAEVANAFGRQYIETTRNRKAALTDQASGWLAERVSVLREKLDEAESALLNFREENGLVSFKGDVGGLNEQQIGIVTRELIDARQEMQEARVLAREVASARLVGAAALEQIPTIAADPGVLRARISLQETERTLNELRNRYLDRHPKVVDALSNVRSAEVNLERQVLNLADQLDRRYRIAQENVASLRRDLDGEKTEIQSLGRKQLALLELEREVQINSDLYQRFFDRVRETEEARSLTNASASIADPASVPRAPVRPKKTLILFLVFVLTALAASGTVFAMEDFKDTIQGIHDVETKIGLDVLGVVPAVKSDHLPRSEAGHTLTPRRIRDKSGQFVESMRTLRTGIRLLDAKRPCKTIMITSSVPDEGKSTVASNLAQSLARTERVLLIEADLRRPGIARSLNLDGPGFADILRGEILPSGCIHKRAISDVHLLTAGRIDDDSPELLLEPALGPMLRAFEKHYDRIVIDSAPVQAVSDALILGQHADTTLFVVKADDTSSAIVARAVDRLRHHQIDLCGAVISQVDLRQVARYGGDYYYQGYFDKYGYGEEAGYGSRARAA